MPDSKRPPYQRRLIAFQGLVSSKSDLEEGWRVKIYSVVREKRKRNEDLFHEVRDGKLLRTLFSHRRPTQTALIHRLGFVVVHESFVSDYVTFHWWENWNERRQQLFLRENGGDWCVDVGLAGCPWDDAIVGFEGDAWRAYMLAGDSPRPDEYLLAKLKDMTI